MEQQSDKLFTMINFARRSGKIVFGLDGLKTAKGVKLLVVSDAASDNLVRGLNTIADAREIPLVCVPSLEDRIGNNVKALGLTDGNMAQAAAEYAESAPQYTIRYGKRR